MSSLPALRVRPESFRLTTADVVTLAGSEAGIHDNERFDYVVSTPDMKTALLVDRLRPGADLEVLGRRGSRRAYLFAFDGAGDDRLLGVLAFTALLARDSRGQPSYDLAVHELLVAEPTMTARAANALIAGLCRTVLVDLESLHGSVAPEFFLQLTHTQSLNYHAIPDPLPARQACERIAGLFEDTRARLAAAPRESAVAAA